MEIILHSFYVDIFYVSVPKVIMKAVQLGQHATSYLDGRLFHLQEQNKTKKIASMIL